MNGLQKPKDECEVFLARQQPWIQAIFKGKEALDFIEVHGYFAFKDILWRAMDEYEELLRDCPMHFREYRRSREKLAMWTINITLPSIKRGRPGRRSVRDLGRKAALLRQRGFTWGQVAQIACPQKDQLGHRCGKQCADRLRQSAQPYLRSK